MPPPEITGGAKGGLWNFNALNTDTSTAPVSGRFRTNVGIYRNATQIAIHRTTIQGVDRADTLRALLVDDIIQCQDNLVIAAWCRYVLQSPPVDKGDWFQLNVALEADGNITSGPPPENQEIVILFTANSNAVAVPVYAETTAYITTTLQMMGALDTVPQQTDGMEILTASITPKRASNKLRIQAAIPFSGSGTGPGGGSWFALFRDSTPAAIHATVLTSAGKDDGNIATLNIDIPAGAISPTTFKLRCGNVKGVTQTVGINGSSTARWMGGASRATLSIMEHV